LPFYDIFSRIFILTAISGLTTTRFRLKNTAISGATASLPAKARTPEFMNPTRPAQSPTVRTDPKECKHPRVRVVAREEEAEFVECIECGEVFESSEFRDMDIEESKLKEI
jgi:hypothetical protein